MVPFCLYPALMSALQQALAALKSDDRFALARARAMLTVYDEHWSEALRDYQVLDVEREFCFPLLNPETEAPSRSFDEAGKMDVLVCHIPTQHLVVMEHKTTAEPVSPDSDYWDRLRMDNQCSKYYLAASQLGLGEVDHVLYDVMHKPAQRPATIPERDGEGFKIVLDSAGNRVMSANGKKPRESADPERGWVLKSRPETPEEFEARLLSLMRVAPLEYFAQREVPRLNSDILEYMADAWAVGQQLLYFRSRKLWSRNSQACKQYSTCEFYDLCCGRACVDGVRFARREKVHAELSIQAGDHGANGGTRELLTNSRCSAFNKCRRYHKLRYEDRIERVEPESEALQFGTLIHAGLEAYYNALKGSQS
jgi:hypothetical protein